jgi:hypothetical protein
MTTPWPSISSIARTIFVCSLIIAGLIFALPRSVTGRIGSVRSRVREHPALTLLLVTIFVTLGICSFAGFSDKPDPTPVVAVCNFGAEPTCASHNPAVTVYYHRESNFTACRFSEDVDWGDGSRHSTVAIRGGGNGFEVLANHTYKQPGTYPIVVKVKTTVGPCKASDSQYQFEYVK